MNGKVYYENFNGAYSTSQRMDGTNAGTAADNGEKPRYEVAFVFLLTNQSYAGSMDQTTQQPSI